MRKFNSLHLENEWRQLEADKYSFANNANEIKNMLSECISLIDEINKSLDDSSSDNFLYDYLRKGNKNLINQIKTYKNTFVTQSSYVEIRIDRKIKLLQEEQRMLEAEL